MENLYCSGACQKDATGRARFLMTDERPVVRAYLGSYGILGAYVSVDVPGRHVLEPGGPVRGMLCPSRRVQGLRVRRLHRRVRGRGEKLQGGLPSVGRRPRASKSPRRPRRQPRKGPTRARSGKASRRLASSVPVPHFPFPSEPLE